MDLEPTPSGNGYWVVDDLGRVFASGDAVSRGNVVGSRLAAGEKVTSLSATKTGGGYWIFTGRGRVLTFGDAPFLGDVSEVILNGPVLDSITTPSGQGYYMVASDGGIFAFDDFKGSLGSVKLNRPITGMVRSGSGYLMVGKGGGIFDFSGTPDGFKGSLGANPPANPIVSVAVLDN